MRWLKVFFSVFYVLDCKSKFRDIESIESLSEWNNNQMYYSLA